MPFSLIHKNHHTHHKVLQLPWLPRSWELPQVAVPPIQAVQKRCIAAEPIVDLILEIDDNLLTLFGILGVPVKKAQKSDIWPVLHEPPQE